jgi:hypothetical protein
MAGSNPLTTDAAEIAMERLAEGYMHLYKQFLWVDMHRENYSIDRITALYHLKNMRFLFMYSQIPDYMLENINEALEVKPEPVLSTFTQLKIRFSRWILSLRK